MRTACGAGERVAQGAAQCPAQSHRHRILGTSASIAVVMIMSLSVSLIDQRSVSQQQSLIMLLTGRESGAAYPSPLGRYGMAGRVFKPRGGERRAIEAARH